MTTLTQYAEKLLEDAKRLDSYSASHHLPPTSFKEDTLIDLTLEEEQTRKSVVDGAEKIKKLGLGGVSGIFDIAWGSVDILALYAMYHYRIPQHVPIDHSAPPTTFDDLHSRLSDPKPSVDRLRRFLKMAIANQIFDQPTPDTIIHNAASRALVNAEGLSDWLGMFLEDFLPAIGHTIEATDKFSADDLEESTKSAFQLAHQTEGSLFSFMKENHERGRRYYSALAFLARFQGFDVKFLINGYPGWEALNAKGKQNEATGGGKMKMVDVGGGYGSFSIALAKAFPHLDFVVQDLSNVIKHGEAQLKRIIGLENEGNETEKDWKARVTFMEHDMFTEQPVKGADVYFTKWVFPTWTDTYCLKMLKSLVPALEPGKSKVLLCEYLVPEIVQDSYSEKVYTEGADMLMMAGWNGKQRTMAEFQRLFEAADPRFKFQGAVRPEGSGMWIIEATFEETEAKM